MNKDSKLRKLISVILIVMVALGLYMVPVTTSKASVIVPEFSLDGVNYKVLTENQIGGTLQVVTYTGTEKTVVLPDWIEVGTKIYKVTEIGEGAFMNCKSLKKVKLGKFVTVVKTKAFYNCKNLKDMAVRSATLKSIGKNALKKTNKKLLIKTSKTKAKKYKKLFAKKGNTKVKVKGVKLAADMNIGTINYEDVKPSTEAIGTTEAVNTKEESATTEESTTTETTTVK